MSHKHIWQFVRTFKAGDFKGLGGIEYARFICECGKTKIVETKK